MTCQLACYTPTLAHSNWRLAAARTSWSNRGDCSGAVSEKKGFNSA